MPGNTYNCAGQTAKWKDRCPSRKMVLKLIWNTSECYHFCEKKKFAFLSYSNADRFTVGRPAQDRSKCFQQQMVDRLAIAWESERHRLDAI
jgi:hypothetical protein